LLNSTQALDIDGTFIESKVSLLDHRLACSHPVPIVGLETAKLFPIDNQS